MTDFKVLTCVAQDTGISTGLGGMLPVALHGTVVIAQGILAIYGTSGDLIASGPVSTIPFKVRRAMNGDGVWATINGKKYYLAIGSGRQVPGGWNYPASLPPMMAGDPSFAVLADTDTFMMALEQILGPDYR